MIDVACVYVTGLELALLVFRCQWVYGWIF